VITVRDAVATDVAARMDVMVTESPNRFLKLVDACWKAVS
jgi:hypothetical protein